MAKGLRMDDDASPTSRRPCSQLMHYTEEIIISTSTQVEIQFRNFFRLFFHAVATRGGFSIDASISYYCRTDNDEARVISRGTDRH